MFFRTPSLFLVFSAFNARGIDRELTFERDITLIRSMQSGVNHHAQGLYALMNGRVVPGRTTIGSWLTHGLDHTKLNYKRNGSIASRTDGQGTRVVRELLA